MSELDLSIGRVTSFFELTDSRDAACKAFQYSGKILSACMAGAGSTSRIDRFVDNITTSRYLLRLGKSANLLLALRKFFQSEYKDRMFVLGTVGVHVGYACYFLLENIYVLMKVGFLKGNVTKARQKMVKALLVGVLFGILADSHRLIKISQARNKLDKRLRQGVHVEPEEIKRIEIDRSRTIVSLIGKLGDLLASLGNQSESIKKLFGFSVPPLLAGIGGATAALSATASLWNFHTNYVWADCCNQERMEKEARLAAQRLSSSSLRSSISSAGAAAAAEVSGGDNTPISPGCSPATTPSPLSYNSSHQMNNHFASSSQYTNNNNANQQQLNTPSTAASTMRNRQWLGVSSGHHQSSPRSHLNTGVFNNNNINQSSTSGVVAVNPYSKHSKSGNKSTSKKSKRHTTDSAADNTYIPTQDDAKLHKTIHHNHFHPNTSHMTPCPSISSDSLSSISNLEDDDENQLQTGRNENLVNLYPSELHQPPIKKHSRKSKSSSSKQQHNNTSTTTSTMTTRYSIYNPYANSSSSNNNNNNIVNSPAMTPTGLMMISNGAHSSPPLLIAASSASNHHHHPHQLQQQDGFYSPSHSNPNLVGSSTKRSNNNNNGLNNNINNNGNNQFVGASWIGGDVARSMIEDGLPFFFNNMINNTTAAIATCSSNNNNNNNRVNMSSATTASTTTTNTMCSVTTNVDTSNDDNVNNQSLISTPTTTVSVVSSNS